MFVFIFHPHSSSSSSPSVSDESGGEDKIVNSDKEAHKSTSNDDDKQDDFHPDSEDHDSRGCKGSGELVAKYSVAILDIPSDGEVCAENVMIDLPASLTAPSTCSHNSHAHSPVDIIESRLIPVLQTSIHEDITHRKSLSPNGGSSRSASPDNVGTGSHSRHHPNRQPHGHNHNDDKSRSRSPSVKTANSSRSGSSNSCRSASSSRSRSRSKSDSRSRSRSKSRSRSRSNSSSSTASSNSSRSARSIPRRRGSPSFLERRRITR